MQIERKRKYANKVMNKKILFVLLLASLAAVPVTFNTGCAVTQGRESTWSYVDDKSISNRIKTNLYRDPDVKGTQVSVTTFRGEVQLSGFADTQAQKDWAGEIARQTPGVIAVHNDLIVPTGR